jgi:hypothetical protein
MPQWIAADNNEETCKGDPASERSYRWPPSSHGSKFFFSGGAPASVHNHLRARSRTLRGRLVGGLLAGAWRHSPPLLSTGKPQFRPGQEDELEAYPTADELEEIAPSLLRSGAAALAWRKICDSDLISSSAGRQLQQAYRYHSLEAALHERRLKQAVPVLRNLGAEPLLVKGWAIARLYPEPGLRPYCDLDLCVSPDRYAVAAAALKAPEIQGCGVDLHLGFGKFYERDTDDIFARSRLVSLGDLRVRVLGAEDDLRFLCVHLLRHGAARPLWLADVAVLLESRPDDFDWDRCLSTSRSSRGTAAELARGYGSEGMGNTLRNSQAGGRLLTSSYFPVARTASSLA